jgi:protein tyrosine/serine phosphatase
MPIELTVAPKQSPSGNANRRAPWSPRRRRLALLALICLIAVVAINHRQVTALRDRFIPKRWGVVEEGRIFRSGQLSRYLVKEMLERNHVQVVVDLTFDDPAELNHEAELRAIHELGIERQLFPLKADGTGDVQIYAAAVAAVARAAREDKPVLVHCFAGAQRTGGVVALYRLLVQGKSPDFVLREMRQYKYDPVYSPLLLEYLNEHIAEIADDLVRDGTIASVPSPLPRLGG